jgi:hypothetical protein
LGSFGTGGLISGVKTTMRNQKVIVRTYSAGVFFGTLVSRKGKEGVLKNAIRIWRWSGAASLSELAVSGVKNASDCKFAIPVPSITLTEIIEVIETTKTAQANIEAVPSWRA